MASSETGDRPTTRLILALAILLFAMGSPVIKWLLVHGGGTGIVSTNAISFCNVLFVGNFCAGIAAFLMFGPRRVVRDVKKSFRAALGWSVLDAVFAVAVPTLAFTALQTTSVTNLVLLGRVEAPAYAVLSVLVFGAAVSRWQWLGYGIITTGVVSLVLFEGMFMVSRGDFLVIAASILFAVGSIVSKRVLEHSTVPAFVFIRNVSSAIVFYAIAVALYGPRHFADVFGPGLWV